jgi:type IV pilus assembly protein PilA
MISRIQNRLLRVRDDEGFTLIELMVVVLIIAILIAIAIPTFLGARERAQERAAQSSLRNTVTAAKAIFTDQEDYTNATVALLTSEEPAIQFVAANTISTDDKIVSVDGNPDGVAAPTKSNVFTAAAFSDAGTCWFLQDTATATGGLGGTRWAKNSDVVGGAGCTADAAALIADGSWTGREPGTAAEV